MTATSVRHGDLDGDAGVVHVAIPWGCHTPRLGFMTDEPRVLSQLLQSRRGAQTGFGGVTVSWTEGEVAIRVDLADRAAEDSPPAPAGESLAAPAAAAAAPATTSRSVSARRRRTSGTLNLSRAETGVLEELIERALDAHPTGLDLDLLRAIKAKLERLPHLEAVA
jgi:cytochrome c1